VLEVVLTMDDLLRDLALAMLDPDGQRDPEGMMQAWAQIATGVIDPDRVRYGIPGQPTVPAQRQKLILELARSAPVTSGQLAALLHYDAETMRKDLRVLAHRGLLMRTGRTRDTVYRDGGTSNRPTDAPECYVAPVGGGTHPSVPEEVRDGKEDTARQATGSGGGAALPRWDGEGAHSGRAEDGARNGA
jgi:hypothetical protein